MLLSKLFKPDFPFRPKSLPFHYGWVVAVAGATGIVASIPGQTIGVNVFNDDDFWQNEVGVPKPTIEGLGSRKIITITKR